MTEKRRRELHPRSAAGAEAWRAAFLNALRNSCNVLYACRAAGIGRTTVYDHRAKDAAFAQAWDTAKVEAVELLELEARDRAMKKSDLLMIFLLKAHKPEMYRETSNVNVNMLSPEDAANLTDTQLAAELKRRGLT
jgi:hypothetical protein